MEYDRYQTNKTVFVLGMIGLVLSIALILFSVYIFPAIILTWVYDIPEFIFHWIDWFEINYNLSSQAASWVVFLLFFIPGLILGIIAYYSSNRIDNQLYEVEPEEVVEDEPVSREERIRQRETLTFGLKIFILIILVLILAAIFEWMLYIEPQL